MSTDARPPGAPFVTPRAFAIALGAVVLAFAGLCVRLAAHEYFKFDDWYFLNAVQRDSFDWGRVFLPIGTHRFWAIRPLGEQTYFRLGFQAFGLDATGYLLVSLAVHALTGVVTWRIARVLGLDGPIAAVTGVLAATRPPSMAMVWSGCGFAYMLSQLAVATSVMAFLSSLPAPAATTAPTTPTATRRAGVVWSVLSVAALAAALLSHESSVVVPGVLFVFAVALDPGGGGRARVVGALGRVMPHAVLVLLYLGVRYGVVAPFDAGESGYQLATRPMLILSRYGLQLGELVGGRPTLAAVAASMALTAAWIARTPDGRAALGRLGRSIGLPTALWIVAVLAPMVALSPRATRFSVHAEVPACLLVGALLQAAWGRAGPRARAFAPAALVALVAVALPWSALAGRLQDESLQFPRQVRDLLEAEAARIPPDADLVFVYGDAGLADWTAMQRFRSVSYGHTPMVSAMLPGRRATARTHDLCCRPRPDALCADCVYLSVAPDLTVAFMSDDEVRRQVVEPALASGKAEIVRLGGARLFDLDGRAALERLERHCDEASRVHDERTACRQRFASAIIRRGTADARFVARRLRQVRPVRQRSAPSP